jgi:hypothetical protein
MRGEPRWLLEHRFESKVRRDRKAGCWLWRGSKRGGGYGQFSIKGKLHAAHRVAFELYNGPIPDGLCVCHKCDVRECVNPDHLFLGTQADNVRDRDEKGRTSKGKKHALAKRHALAKLTEAAVRDIRTKRMTQVEFAKLYGVSPVTICLAQRGETWAHVKQDKANHASSRL